MQVATVHGRERCDKLTIESRYPVPARFHEDGSAFGKRLPRSLTPVIIDQCAGSSHHFAQLVVIGHHVAIEGHCHRSKRVGIAFQGTW